MAIVTIPELSRRDITQSQADVCFPGEKRLMKARVFAYDDAGQIIMPSTLELSDEQVDVFNCADFTTVLFTDTPDQDDIMEDGVKKGVLLSYLVDTSVADLVSPASYALLFTFTQDNGETRKSILYFNVVALANPLEPE